MVCIVHKIHRFDAGETRQYVFEGNNMYVKVRYITWTWGMKIFF